MKAKFFFILILIALFSSANAQKKKEIWYTWIDTKMEINGETVRVVSDEIMELTCCVSSAKYQRFSEKVSQWLDKNVQGIRIEESPFTKTKDRALAEKILGDAIRKSENNPSLKVVTYDGKCK